MSSTPLHGQPPRSVPRSHRLAGAPVRLLHGALARVGGRGQPWISPRMLRVMSSAASRRSRSPWDVMLRTLLENVKSKTNLTLTNLSPILDDMDRVDLSTVGKRLAHVRLLAREDDSPAPFPASVLGTMAGLSHSAVRDIERGISAPRASTVRALANVLAEDDAERFAQWLTSGKGRRPTREEMRSAVAAAERRAQEARAS